MNLQTPVELVFFILDHLNFILRNQYKLNVVDCEDSWLEIDLPGNKSLVVGIIYRHPKHCFLNFQEKLINTINLLNYSSNLFILGGDLNIDLLSNSSLITDYQDLLLSIGSYQSVNAATRFSSDFVNSSLLDHVYTNALLEQINTRVILFEITDHLPVITSIKKIKPPKFNKSIHTMQDFKNFNENDFLIDLNSKLENLNSISIDNNTNPNNLWNEFEKIFNDTVYTHAPLKPITRKKKRMYNKPWLTRGILKSIQTKNIMFKFALNNKSEKFSRCFKKYRNLLTRVKGLSKRLYYQQAVNSASGNSKKLWKTINNIITYKLPKNNQIDQIEDNDAVTVRNPFQISNILNENFVSMADKLVQERLLNINQCSKKCFYGQSLCNSFFIEPIVESEIKRFINNMDSRKSCRSDAPKIKFLKTSVNIITPVITKIFNLCIVKGVFPDSFKLAEVVPIFKSGNKNNMNNYRPISLLSPFSKIFESYVYDQLIQYLDKNEVLYKLQYGFRKDSSTELAVTQIVDDIIDVIENNSIQCSVFLDLAKAFDTVNHDILTYKLEKYGVRGPPLLLINSFLRNRCQSTIVNSVRSSSKIIKSGVPQGSSLGPLLFLLYINDLPLCTNLKVTLFADDACLSFSDVNPVFLEKTVNTELVKVSDWLNSNKLFINYSKSNFLIFTKKRIEHKFNVILDNSVIVQSHNTKYLGIIIDDKLDWKDHITNLKSKLARSSYILNKIKPYVNKATLKLIYYSIIYPHLQYGIANYGTAATCNLDPIVKLQKRIIRNICYQSARSHTNPLFLENEILKFKDIHRLQIAKLMHKYFKGQHNGHIQSITLSNKHNYNTRLASSNNYFMPQPRTNLGLSSLRYLGPKIWQSVPTEFKDSTFNNFKSKYKKHLVQSYLLV